MAASNNLASLEPWSLRPASFPDSWISDAFSRDTEALTRALQQSLYSNTQSVSSFDASENNNNNNNKYCLYQLPKTEPVNTTSPVSISNDTDVYPKRRSSSSSSGCGKVTKRKSRASKRATTTFIAADPSNFRQMVQQVTGIQFGEMQMPVSSVLKPEPQRPGNGNGNRIQNYGLPTLDTSECWLGRRVDVGSATAPVAGAAIQGNGSVVMVGDAGSGSPDFDYGMFPTLESWQ